MEETKNSRSKMNVEIPGQSYLWQLLKQIVKEQTLILVFVAIIIVMGVLTPVFLTTRNLLNVLLQSSMVGVSAAGMTMLILMGDIDLSVGSVSALAGVLTAFFQVQYGWSTFSAIAFALSISFVLGIAAGAVCAKLGVHSFVATLGLLSIARGFALIITNGNPITGLSPSLNFLGQGKIWIIPFPTIMMFIVIIITWFFLTQTKSGRAVYAIGGNKEASRLAGIDVDRIRIILFGVCALLAGLSGIILAGRVNSGQPTASQDFNLDVIASVIIGGTSLYGGRGGVWKTVLGTLIFGVLHNGLNLIGVTPYWQKVFIGLLIVATVAVDRIQHKSEG
ncbi:MAG: ABC transporter permease [Candidatus Caldatribacteriaceae bacterium]